MLNHFKLMFLPSKGKSRRGRDLCCKMTAIDAYLQIKYTNDDMIRARAVALSASG